MIKSPVVSVGVDGAETLGNPLSGGLPTVRSYQLQHGQHCQCSITNLRIWTLYWYLISILESLTTLVIKMTKGCF